MNNVFKYVFISIAAIFIVSVLFSKINFAVDNENMKNPGSSKDELIKTDKEFSQKCIKDGMASAFLAYADDDVILMRDNHFPIVGKKELKKHYSEIKNGNDKLEWSPVKAEVAESGELGYTFGNWTYTAKNNKGDTNKTYGNYVTIWKKQRYGSWKFVLDGGNTVPGIQIEMKNLE